MHTWLGSRRALAIALAVPLLLAALSVTSGFVTDDQGFRAVLHADARPAWDLFDFQAGDRAVNTEMVRVGRLAWWAAPDLKVHFLRPLTGELFALDDEIFGDAAAGYHLHSLLWFALLLGGVAAFYRKLLPPAAATLGVAVFGLAAAHTEAIAWLSARHILVGGAGAAWALALYCPGRCLRQRGAPDIRPACDARAGDRTRRWLGLAPLAIGLLGSESALGAVPLWCGLAIACTPTWRARLRECAPPIALGIAYLALYVALGGGTRGGDAYHDPIGDPLGFLLLALTRVPILAGDAALAIPSELAFVVPVAALAIAGALAALFVALAARATRPHLPGAPEVARGGLGWLVAGGLLALLPGVAGYPTGRVLLVPDLAFAALIGSILARALARSANGERHVPALGKALAIVLAVARLVWSPLVELHEQRALVRRGALTDRVAREVAELVPPHSRAILVAAWDPFVFLYPRGVLAETEPGHVTCWSVLSGAHSRHRLTRTGERSFDLEPLDRPLLAGGPFGFDALFRAPDHPFAVGDTFDQCGATIRVAAVTDGKPAKLSISFQRRLDDPKLAFLAWRDRHIERVALPAVGAAIELP